MTQGFIVMYWHLGSPGLEGTKGKERGVLFVGTSRATVYPTRQDAKNAITRT